MSHAESDTHRPRWKFERDRGHRAPVGKPSVVYFIECAEANAVKIGFTCDIKLRLATLQISSPFELKLLGTIPGDGAHERRLHSLFRKEHIRGEWFRCGGPLESMIDYLLRLPEAKRTEVIEREPSLPESFCEDERNEEARNRIRRLVEAVAEEKGPWFAAQLYERACHR